MNPPAGSNQQIILHRLDEIVNTIAEVRTAVSALDQRLQAIEKTTIKEQAETSGKINAAEVKLQEHGAALGEHEKSLKALHDAVLELKEQNKITRWFAGLAGGGVILWLLNQLLAVLS